MTGAGDDRPSPCVGVPPALEQLLTTSEIADATGYGEEAVRRWIGKGELRAVRIGGQFRVQREDFLAFLKERETKKPSRSRRKSNL